MVLRISVLLGITSTNVEVSIAGVSEVVKSRKTLNEHSPLAETHRCRRLNFPQNIQSIFAGSLGSANLVVKKVAFQGLGGTDEPARL